MPTFKTRKSVIVRTAEELGQVLGLSAADTAEMEFRSDLTVALAKIIQAGRLTHAEIAKCAGSSRARVTAIANGNTHGVSTDVLIRVLAATGHRAEVRVKKDGKDTHIGLVLPERARLGTNPGYPFEET
jgi:predicted XRE-type DNA-binding protein